MASTDAELYESDVAPHAPCRPTMRPDPTRRRSHARPPTPPRSNAARADRPTLPAAVPQSSGRSRWIPSRAAARVGPAWRARVSPSFREVSTSLVDIMRGSRDAAVQWRATRHDERNSRSFVSRRAASSSALESALCVCYLVVEGTRALALAGASALRLRSLELLHRAC